MKIECSFKMLVPTADLKPHPRNRNKHPPEQIEKLAKILTYQGWRYPIKVSNQSGFITSGHGRLLAAMHLGWTQVPVDFQDYATEEQEYADVQADNLIAYWSEIDLSGINLDIQSMPDDFDVEMLGLKPYQIESEDSLNQMKEWIGMPDYSNEDKTSIRHVIIHFSEEKDVKDFFKLIGQNDTGNTKSVWFPPQERMDTESKRYE